MTTDAPAFPLMALRRHRLGIDGQGVTTLVAAWDCPLRCQYCLNSACQEKDTPRKMVTPEELYAMTRADDLYFQATLGGVTFGGGEPLTHARFIRSFRELIGNRWRIGAETGLYISPEDLTIAIETVDSFLVDIKDIDPGIYRRYTGRDNALPLRNLRTLLDAVSPKRVVVRVPRIPGYNTEEDVLRTEAALRSMGCTQLDVFTYIIRNPHTGGSTQETP